MGRLRRILCPTCQVELKLPGRGYCAPCLKVYQKTYNALWKARTKRKLRPNPEPARPDAKDELMADYDLEPYGRKHLGLTDNLHPSTDHLEAYCGWGVDRHTTFAYRRSVFTCSNDWNQLDIIGHQAVRRFWTSMNGSAWEMGPDSHEFVDGSFGWSSQLKGFRFGLRRNTPRKQVR